MYTSVSTVCANGIDISLVPIISICSAVFVLAPSLPNSVWIILGTRSSTSLVWFSYDYHSFDSIKIELLKWSYSNKMSLFSYFLLRLSHRIFFLLNNCISKNVKKKRRPNWQRVLYTFWIPIAAHTQRNTINKIWSIYMPANMQATITRKFNYATSFSPIACVHMSKFWMLRFFYFLQPFFFRLLRLGSCS